MISGNEDFSIKERANDLVRELCGEIPEDEAGLEIIRGDTENEKFTVAFDSLLDTLATPSFLSSSKVVWLKHFTKFDDAFAEPSTKKKKSRIDLLSDFLKDGLPDDVTLIIDGPGLDRRKAFYKLCEKTCDSSGGELFWFEKTDPKAKGFEAQLIRKIKEQVLNAGFRIDDSAVSFLIETIGADTARLKNEMDKLICYKGNDRGEISLADCYEICSRSSETLAWEFSGALAERDASKALSLIPGIIESMEQEKGGSSSSRPEMAIVSAAHAEFQRILAVKCVGQEFGIPDRASPDFFYKLVDEQKDQPEKNPVLSMHPYRVFKIWENAVRFSNMEIVRAFKVLSETNMAMISG